MAASLQISGMADAYLLQLSPYGSALMRGAESGSGLHSVSGDKLYDAANARTSIPCGRVMMTSRVSGLWSLQLSAALVAR